MLFYTDLKIVNWKS